MALRLLVFGNSHDLIDGGDGRGTTMWRMAAAIEEYTGETVALRYTVAYPNSGLARYVKKVVDEFDPDIVLLHCSGHVVGPRTLAYRLQHLLGTRQYALYKRLAAAVQRTIGVRIEGSQQAKRGLLPALYFFVRDGMVRAGFGDSMMSVADAASGYGAAIRQLATHEALTILVRGPMYSTVNEAIRGVQAHAERRIREFDAALARQCADRRIAYCSMIEVDPLIRPSLLPDHLHRGPEGHAIIAAVELGKLPQPYAGRNRSRLKLIEHT